jgi:glyoxylate reductase
MKRILITRQLPDDARQLLEAAGMSVTMWHEDRDMTHNELCTEARNHDAVITIGANSIRKEFFEACPNIQMISQFAVGYDNIDIQEATSRRIPIGNTPHAVTHATADVAFMLMLAVSRKIFWLHKQIIKGNWKQFEPVKNLGIELRGKTLGIFGMGRIGIEMANRCIGAFDMNVIYHNRTRNQVAEKKTNAVYVPFNELLAKSDVLSVHAWLSDETRNRFNADAFNQMKSSAIFINTSRGGLHDEQALIAALQNKKIWGAGLDVTNPEPMTPDNPLLEMENVAIVPHIGSGTVETRSQMAITAANNIISFFETGQVNYCVNPEVLISPAK